MNLVNVHSFVNDNCVIIHSNVMHTWASWGIFLCHIAHSYFPPQNAFSVLPLLDSNQVVFTLPIFPYEVYLSEVIGVGEG
jgi:hypothetical protein